MSQFLDPLIRAIAPQYIAFCYRSGCWAGGLVQAACLRLTKLD